MPAFDPMTIETMPLPGPDSRIATDKSRIACMKT
jgi:hypothetical protein